MGEGRGKIIEEHRKHPLNPETLRPGILNMTLGCSKHILWETGLVVQVL